MRKDDVGKVYLINGFLESGKTEFFNYTLKQLYFRSKETTLLIVCEEGELEYDVEELEKDHIFVEYLSKESDFTLATLNALEEKYQPKQILIEYNGMWNHKDVPIADNWEFTQQISVIDASTFPMYYTNMKFILGEMIRLSNLIIFNRADGIEELATYKRNVSIVNQQAEIVFEGANSEITVTLDEELPYDLDADFINLSDEMYGIWYLDAMNAPEKYVGKRVTFQAEVYKKGQYPKNYFLPMRTMMVCCMDDLAMLGFICEYKGAFELQAGDWVEIDATISQAFLEEHGSGRPVLHAATVTKIAAPSNPILEF